MKPASISDLKKELQLLPPQKLQDLCLALAKYKKDNKEYLGYLLFDEDRKHEYVAELKAEMDEAFSAIDTGQNLYYTRKNLRRILRTVNRYCKYLSDKSLAAGLRIHFLKLLRDSGIAYTRHKLLENLYYQELKKIDSLVSGLHEDLRADFSADLEALHASG